jgi:glutathione S-transferase
MDIVMNANESVGHPPHFAPPVLEILAPSSSESSYISQTPAILAFLAPILGLDGAATTPKLDDFTLNVQRAQINQIVLTILDLNNEAHDTHHPISSSSYYEEQKEEALARSKDFRKSRVPKFFQCFQSTIEANPSSDQWLISPQYTVADLALFQVSCLDTL